jgi:hypothetical protein
VLANAQVNHKIGYSSGTGNSRRMILDMIESASRIEQESDGD